MANVQALRTEPRIIDPNSSLEKQVAVLESLIDNPPENSRIITFTPELAEHILDTLNSSNRNKRPARIRRFAGDMATGRWSLTGDTIKFGKSRTLRDGQNRLEACRHSKKRFRSHVVFGVEDRAFAVMDTGAIRTGIDAFNIAGVANYRIAAPAVRWLAIYKDSMAKPNRAMSIDNASLIDFLKNHVNRERLDVAVERAMAAGQPFPAGSLAALLYLFEEKDPKTTAKFAADLETGKGRAKTLAKKLTTMRKQQAGRMHELQIAAFIIQTFNAYRSGKRPTLHWTEDGNFPSI